MNRRPSFVAAFVAWLAVLAGCSGSGGGSGDGGRSDGAHAEGCPFTPVDCAAGYTFDEAKCTCESNTGPGGEGGLVGCPGTPKCGGPCSQIGLTCAWCPPGGPSCNQCQNMPSLTCEAVDGGGEGGAGDSGAGVWGQCIYCGV